MKRTDKLKIPSNYDYESSKVSPSKVSRVQEAIALMPPQPTEIPKKIRPQHRPITPIVEEAPQKSSSWNGSDEDYD